MINYLYCQNVAFVVSPNHKHTWKVDAFILGHQAMLREIAMPKGQWHDKFADVAGPSGLKVSRFSDMKEMVDWCDTMFVFWDGNQEHKELMNDMFLRTKKPVQIFLERLDD